MNADSCNWYRCLLTRFATQLQKPLHMYYMHMVIARKFKETSSHEGKEHKDPHNILVIHNMNACLIMTLKVTTPPPFESFFLPVTSSCLATSNVILFCSAMQALRITCFAAAQWTASTCSSPRPVAVNTFQSHPWINLKMMLIASYHYVFHRCIRARSTSLIDICKQVNTCHNVLGSHLASWCKPFLRMDTESLTNVAHSVVLGNC